LRCLTGFTEQTLHLPHPVSAGCGIRESRALGPLFKFRPNRQKLPQPSAAVCEALRACRAKSRRPAVRRVRVFAPPLLSVWKEVAMRLFDMFLRRAGLTRADALRRNRAVSRLTIECPENMLSGLRQRIYADFRAAGLNVSQVQIQRGEGGQMASACVTVDCPADKRAELVSQARRLGQQPGVHRVRFGAARNAGQASQGSSARAA